MPHRCRSRLLLCPCCCPEQFLHHIIHRERIWKLKVCKRTAVTVSKSNLDIESRQLVRERTAEAAIRKQAKFIAQQVRPHREKAAYHSINSCPANILCCPAASGHLLKCVHDTNA